MKTEKMCVGHKCEECGKELVEPLEKWLSLLIIATMFAGIVIAEIFFTKNYHQPTNTNCYIRTQIGDGNGLTVTYKTQDVECPK